MPQPLMPKKRKLTGFYEDLQNLLELTPKQMSFSFYGLEYKSRKSRDNWYITGKFGLGVENEAGQRLTEFCQENTVVIANIIFQQSKR